MGWNRLDQIGQLAGIATASQERPQLILKHSTRCSISAAAKYRLELGLDKLASRFDVHFLDLISHREVSNEVAERLGVRHESPQVIVVYKGRPVINLTHYDIDTDRILQQADALHLGAVGQG